MDVVEKHHAGSLLIEPCQRAFEHLLRGFGVVILGIDVHIENDEAAFDSASTDHAVLRQIGKPEKARRREIIRRQRRSDGLLPRINFCNRLVVAQRRKIDVVVGVRANRVPALGNFPRQRGIPLSRRSQHKECRFNPELVQRFENGLRGPSARAIIEGQDDFARPQPQRPGLRNRQGSSGQLSKKHRRHSGHRLIGRPQARRHWVDRSGTHRIDDGAGPEYRLHFGRLGTSCQQRRNHSQ